jgi:hypothetical protein
MAAIRVLFLMFFLSADADAVVRRHFEKWKDNLATARENPAAEAEVCEGSDAGTDPPATSAHTTGNHCQA